jgi:quercetin dioxygenase-like cupin family protein
MASLNRRRIMRTSGLGFVTSAARALDPVQLDCELRMVPPMARPGDELVNPVTGQRLLFRRTSRDTNGELLEVEAVYPPKGSPPAEHYHPSQEERFEILSGRIKVHIGDTLYTCGPGGSFTIPASMPHRMWNESDEDARFVWQTRPALKTERLFETFWGLARDGKTDRRGLPGVLQIAVIIREYEDEYRLVRPPEAFQKAVLGPMAVLGRWLGYRGSYPNYSPPDG